MLFKKDKEFSFASKGFYIALIACAFVLCTLAVYGAVSTYAPNTVASPDNMGVKNATPTSSPAPTATVTPASAANAAAPTATATPVPSTPTAVPTPTKAPSASAMTVYVMPVSGRIMADYSGTELVFSSTMQDWRVHNGIDIEASVGTRVSAFTSGTVKDVYFDDSLGQCIIIEHASGLESLYGNLLEAVTVAVGDKVKAGDTIGGVGETAWSECAEATHLHFELYENGSPVDPTSYFEK